MCNGSGTDEAPAPNPVDRTEHMRRIGQTGGYATFARHGSRHMSIIGKTGFTITAARHGREYALALVKGKGWEPKPRPDLLADLRAGRELADPRQRRLTPITGLPGAVALAAPRLPTVRPLEDPMSTATLTKIGTAGTVHGLDVLILADTITVSRDGDELARATVAGLGAFAAAARDLRLGWGAFPDSDEGVIYAYDRADDGFGYAVNLDWPDGSEWGHAPFTSTA